MAQIKSKTVIEEHIKNPHFRFRLLVSILSLVFVLGSVFVYKNTYVYEPAEIPKDTSMSDYQALVSIEVGTESPPKPEDMKSMTTYLNKNKLNTKAQPSFADYQKIANPINNQ